MDGGESRELIRKARRLLFLRRLLARVSLALLVGFSSLALVMLLLLAGGIPGIPSWELGLAAGLVALVVAPGQWHVAPEAAGLYLDIRFGARERFSASTAADPGRSRFAEAVLDDADRVAKDLSANRLVSSWVPPLAPYVAIPVAIVIALALLSEPASLQKEDGGKSAANAIRGQESTPQNRIPLAELIRQIEEAARTYAESGRAQDAQRMLALKQSLVRRLEEDGVDVPVSGAADLQNGKEAENVAAGPGAKAELVDVETILRIAKDVVNGASKAGGPPTPDAPDWSAYAMIEARTPPRRIEGVRAYMNAISRKSNQ